MTTPPPETAPRDPRLVRELVGLVLLVVGAVALVAAAWHLSPWLAVAVAGVAFVGVGSSLVTVRT